MKIVVIDDCNVFQKMTKTISDNSILPYQTLQSFRAGINEIQANTGRIMFVLDGNFPKIERGKVGFNGLNAIEVIENNFQDRINDIILVINSSCSNASKEMKDYAEEKGFKHVHCSYKKPDLYSRVYHKYRE